MRKIGFIKEEQRTKLFEKAGIPILNGANLISIDIQPEYEKAFTFDSFGFGQMINQNYNELDSLTFLYNGADTLGMISEQEYRGWLIEDCGIEEDIIQNSYFYDKGYAFFRYCMDEGIDDNEIVDLVKFMIKHQINDSRDIDEQMWITFMQEYNLSQSSVRDLLENAGDLINVPDLMEQLQKYRGKIVLIGGGLKECLKEVEIALMALNKPYNLFTQYTY